MRVQTVRYFHYKEIPPIFKTFYTLLLGIGLITNESILVAGSYEASCEYWFNKELERLNKNETET